ncbi:MAG: ferritin-like domain-containing protein, partial [Bdellovibrionota bacterium]
MKTPDNTIVIESRVHLFAALAEAAETEHNLMCLYLYAAFSLKRSKEEGVSEEELAMIDRWRGIILGVSLEEMTHLCLVTNLFSALGGTSHFLRPNFPASPGLYPADFVMELAPFDLRTIEHFMFLERPASFEMRDA